MVLCCKILTCGHDFRKGPLKSGCRKTVVSFLFRWNAKLYMFICGTSTTKAELDCDYSYWLGPNYKDNYKEINKTSTVICNHVSWLDTICLY